MLTRKIHPQLEQFLLAHNPILPMIDIPHFLVQHSSPGHQPLRHIAPVPLLRPVQLFAAEGIAMDHSSLDAIGQGDEPPVGMGRKSFRQDNFFLKESEGIKGCEGMRVVDEHDKGGGLRRFEKVWADSSSECFF